VTKAPECSLERSEVGLIFLIGRVGGGKNQCCANQVGNGGKLIGDLRGEIECAHARNAMLRRAA